MRFKFNLRKLETVFQIKSFIFIIIVVWPKFGETKEIEVYPEINSKLLLSKSIVSIAFTSQNQKSPASMFGHTFLIFHNSTPPEPDSIIIEYFGDTSKSFWGNVRAVVFSVPGAFRYNYFSFKQKEYDLEDRDIWIYQLKVSIEEKMQLFNDVIENREQVSSYSFFTGNCSYHLMELIGKSLKEKEIPMKYPFTLPISTIRYFKSKNRLEAGYVVPSSLKKINQSYQKLNENEKLEVKNIINLRKEDQNNKRFEVRVAISQVLNYRLVREEDRAIRNQLFLLKKQFKEPAAADGSLDPSANPNESAFSFGFNFNPGFFYLGIRPAQRNFITTRKDGLENSSLELFQLNLLANMNQITVKELNIFRMLSFQDDQAFSEGFRRYIDVSYYDWGFLSKIKGSEAVARFGSGYSIGLKSLKLALIPYLGFRYFNQPLSSGLHSDFGFKVIANHWLNQTIRYQLTYTQYLFSPFEFKSLFNLTFIPLDNLQRTISLELSANDRTFSKPQIQIAHTFKF